MEVLLCNLLPSHIVAETKGREYGIYIDWSTITLIITTTIIIIIIWFEFDCKDRSFCYGRIGGRVDNVTTVVGEVERLAIGSIKE